MKHLFTVMLKNKPMGLFKFENKPMGRVPGPKFDEKRRFCEGKKGGFHEKESTHQIKHTQFIYITWTLFFIAEEI